MSQEKQKYAELTNIMNLLVDLLRNKSKTEGLYAELWETDPVEYGTDDVGIALQRGRKEAFRAAAELLERYIPKD